MAVNNPRDEPQIERFGTSLPYGKEIYVSLYPEVILAEKDAKDISMVRNFTMDKPYCTYVYTYTAFMIWGRIDVAVTLAMTKVTRIWISTKSILGRTAWRNVSPKQFTKSANVLRSPLQVSFHCTYSLVFATVSYSQ